VGATISVCPAAVVNAPIERVWSVLLDSEHYGDWADARFTRFDPPGPTVAACGSSRSTSSSTRWSSTLTSRLE
jgi:hypothetical protein